MSTVTPQRPAMPRPGPQSRPASPAMGLAANIDPIRVLRRHVGLIMGSIVVGAILGLVAFVLLNRMYPLYASEAVFEIQPGVSDSRDVGSNEIASDQLAARLANTETILLTDRDILRAAVRHPDIRQTDWYQRFMITSLDGNQTFDLESAVDDLEETLRASVIRGTNFFRVRWSAHRPSDVPVVLNSVADAYLARRSEINQADWNANIDVFTSELARTNNELDDLDREIRAFIRERGITSLTDPRYSQASIYAEQLTQEIGTVSSQLSLGRGMLAQTAAKMMGTIQPTFEDVQEAENDPIVAPQLRLITQIKSELHSLRERFGPSHTHVVEMESRLRGAERELQSKMDEVMTRNLEAMHQRLQDQLANMRDRLDELEQAAEEQDKILRDLAADQAQYQALESRRERLEVQRENDMMLIKEINLIRARADARRVRVAQRAQLPREKAFPRIEYVLPLGTLLVMALTVAGIFLRELTDQRIKSASDLAVLPSAKVMGVIPELEEDPTNSAAAELVVVKHPRSVLAESYRQACTSLLRSIERNGHQAILFMGGMPGSGTTTAVTNVAASLAASGKSVLVIDANFRRPRLAASMGVAVDGVGLGDLLIGQASVDDAIVETDIEVSVISAGTPANRVFERLNNGLFDSVLAELRSKFDVILFDAPPAVVAGDAMVLANRVDAALLVVRAHQEQRGLVARLIHQLADARCESLGILLNRPRRTAGGYFKKNFEAMASYSAKG